MLRGMNWTTHPKYALIGLALALSVVACQKKGDPPAEAPPASATPPAVAPVPVQPSAVPWV